MKFSTTLLPFALGFTTLLASAEASPVPFRMPALFVSKEQLAAQTQQYMPHAHAQLDAHISKMKPSSGEWQHLGRITDGRFISDHYTHTDAANVVRHHYFGARARRSGHVDIGHSVGLEEVLKMGGRPTRPRWYKADKPHEPGPK